MKATIITIGDEILIGQIVDTNSVSIARHLNAAGIVVHEKVSIGDDSAQIVGCVERALGQSDIAIITGGLRSVPLSWKPFILWEIISR